MSSDEPPAFGALLSRYRVAVGLTQEELAERAALSAQAIGALERGIRNRPRPYTVRQLTDALGLAGRDRELFERAAREAAASSHSEPVISTGDFLGALPATELVGRSEELGRFHSDLNIVAEGAGQFVLLGGEAGVGKTRLLQELMREAIGRGFATLGGRCYPTEQGATYYPFLQVLASLVSSLPANGRIEGQRLSKKIQELVGRNAVGGGARADTGMERQQLFDAMGRLLLIASGSAPLALLIDDLHWADEPSLKLLQHLVRTTRNARVLLAGSFRDVQICEDHPELAQLLQALSRERLADRLAVRRLSLDETTALVATTMGQQEVSEEFASFVYRRTKGVPRLIDQLVRSLGGRIELRGEIGAGSMGRVFRAFDRVGQRDVAAKLVLARREIDVDALLRFQQEGAVLATLDHPNIVDIYDTFAEEHGSCILMELLEGRSLGTILHDGPLPLPKAKSLAGQVVEALSYAHSQGIVHRDIKPDNVMVIADDQVKVTDFGIARILQPDTSLQTIATTGMRMGTPLYMAPEQIEGKKVDGRTDVYALGAMLYHMVTGRPPFEGADALAVAVKHLQEQPLCPSQVEPTVPRGWDVVILKALAKAPNDRYQSAREMQHAIEALPIEPARPETRRTRRTFPAVAAGVGTSLVTVGVVLALVLPRLGVGQGQSPLQRKLDGYLSSLATQRQLSGTVLVAEKGQMLLAQGYGMADRQKNLPNSPTTEYPAAGVGAMFLTAALKLEEHGRLHDQDHVCAYLPSCPTSWRPMTIRMILDGTAGLPNYGWGIEGNTTAQSLANCQAEPLKPAPGSGQAPYQNCTTLVLGTIIPKVTGTPFAATMRQLIFGPVDMQQSGRITDQLPPSGLARDYSGRSLARSGPYNDFFQIYSTPSDVYRYDNALFSGKLLSHRGLRRLFAPRDVVDPPDPTIVGARWGDQWKVGTAFGRQVTYTTGNTYSFSAVNMRFPAEGVTIIVVSNDDQNNVESVATHVAAMLFGAAAGDAAAAIAPAVSPSRAVVATFKVPASFGVVPSANAVWVLGPPGTRASGSVVRIDPRTNTAATVSVNDPTKMDPGDPALAWVAVGHGQVWVTDRVHNSVDRIDPVTNKVIARISVGIRPFGLTIAGDTLWTDNSYEDPGVVNNTIVKVDLRTQKVVATITNAQTNIGQPYLELHATPNALWFADWGSGTVKRLDPATNKVVASIQTGPQPTSLAVTPGAIWVSNHTSTLVARVDPTTNSMVATIPFEGYTAGLPTASDCCASATVAGAGAIWTIAGAGDRTLVRIDPGSNEANAALTFPQSIDEIAVGDGSLWLAFDHEVDRLDPRAIP